MVVAELEDYGITTPDVDTLLDCEDGLGRALQLMATQPVRPTEAQVMRAIEDFYCLSGNAVGGSLHVVLDDHNLDDASVRFCLDWARNVGDTRGENLALVLLRFEEAERWVIRGRPAYTEV